MIYRGKCPKCGTLLHARPRLWWPEKEWREMWAAFHRLFDKVFR